MAKQIPKSMVLGIAWYRPEQFEAVRAFCEDGNDMDPTYEVWKRGAEKRMRGLQRQGTHVERVDFDLDDFKAWCIANAKRPNGSSRSEFTAFTLRQRHSRLSSKARL